MKMPEHSRTSLDVSFVIRSDWTVPEKGPHIVSAMRSLQVKTLLSSSPSDSFNSSKRKKIHTIQDLKSMLNTQVYHIKRKGVIMLFLIDIIINKNILWCQAWHYGTRAREPVQQLQRGCMYLFLISIVSTRNQAADINMAFKTSKSSISILVLLTWYVTARTKKSQMISTKPVRGKLAVCTARGRVVMFGMNCELLGKKGGQNKKNFWTSCNR